MNSLGVQTQLDHTNRFAQLNGTFVPGGAFINGNPFVHGTSGKVLPVVPNAMVNYYPPFLQKGSSVPGQIKPLTGMDIPLIRPPTMSPKPVPVLPYPVRTMGNLV